MGTGTTGDVARRAISLLDLTELGDDATAADVERLCARAVGPHGTVAAVCVWPRHVALARRLLADTPVRVATVVNFPSGDEPVQQVVDDTRAAIAAGADEIDVVLPHRPFLEGDRRHAADMLSAVRSVCTGHTLKVILESGELQDPSLVAAAAELAVEQGADFVKTSTGKTAQSASLDATAAMLEVIRTAGRPVGLKPSGGIRTLADATAYLEQADAVMGEGWATPATFRFGASGLLTALEAACTDAATPDASEEGY